MLASTGTTLVRFGRPREKAEIAISGIRSSTLGRSVAGRPLAMVAGGSKWPRRMSSTSLLSHAPTTRSKKRRQSRGNDVACGPPITVSVPCRR